jgi:hypothetical protein
MKAKYQPNKGGEEPEVESTEGPSVETIIEERIKPLEEKIEYLETRIAELEAQLHQVRN